MCGELSSVVMCEVSATAGVRCQAMQMLHVKRGSGAGDGVVACVE